MRDGHVYYVAWTSPFQAPPFGSRLRALREQAGLTQAQLAGRAGLHLSAVTRFEQGLRAPSLATAAKLADALGVAVDDFLKPATGAEPGKPPRGRPARKPPAGGEKKPRKRKGD